MAGNIIGEPIDERILKQIDYRQKIQGAGSYWNAGTINRTTPLLTNLFQNSWIKMASGVSIEPGEGEAKLRAVVSQDGGGGDITESEISSLLGMGLAKNLVLFNTIQSLETGDGGSVYTARSGVRDSIFNSIIANNSKMYGGLGNDNKGLQPVGGIIDVSVESINRGSIRKATVNLKVYNKLQFSLVELTYLRLGYIMMLEWGWDKYVDNIEDIAGSPSNITFKDLGPTIIEKEWFSGKNYTQTQMLKLINGYRSQYQGNYDGFFGKVSNYSWKLNTDGSYDITIDLITLGSVIESLQCKIPAEPVAESVVKANQLLLATKLDEEVNDEGQYENPILQNLNSDRISQFIATTILNFPEGNLDFAYLPTLSKYSVGSSGATTNRESDIPETDRYFVRLGYFLEFLKDIVIPFVKNGDTNAQPMCSIDVSETSNICNYVQNLIPLDPSVCIFTCYLDSQFKAASYINGELKNGATSTILKPFVYLSTSQKTVVWGRIMNIYMNMSFLQTELLNNLDDKGNLSLYAYLSAICTGINNATGGTTNLEVSVKDDNIIYILEQNPIKGWDAHRVPPPDLYPIEIMGYNPSNGSSTFVQDFSFETKITPDLMTMISIGATAEGMEAIPFSNWNQGLKNRFEEAYEAQNVPVTPPPVVETGKEYRTSAETIKSQFIADVRADQESFWGTNVDYDIGTGYDWEWKGVNVNDIQAEGSKVRKWSNWEDDIKDEPLLNEVVKRVHELEDKWAAKSSLKGLKVVNDEEEVIPGQEYFQYVVSAFGGKTGTAVSGTFFGFNAVEVSVRDSSWWEVSSNTEFIERGKNSWKTYVTNLNLTEFKTTKVNSSLNGFIPVELGLTMTGISGMNIYNKIAVNQSFLPPAYPSALKFIIRGITHNVSSNNWTTEITTISTTPTLNAPAEGPEFVQNPTTAPSDNPEPTEVKGPIAPIGPNQKLKILDFATDDGKALYPTYGKEISIAQFVSYFNPFVQSKWTAFLNRLDKDYPGYTIRINSLLRTYATSVKLQIANKNNASPGSSPHNFAYGADFNVIDPKGVTYLKKDKKLWVQSGIPNVAKELGMRWGGDFSGYIDCVHFDATIVTEKSKSNAALANKGKPQSQWKTDNINYV